MKANICGAGQAAKSGFGKGLVVVQVALSLVLVASAGLLLATLIRLETMDPGFERAHVLLMDLDLGERPTSAAQRIAIFGRVLDHLRALPGVHSASESDETPLGGAVNASYLQVDAYASTTKERELVLLNEVSDRYFETLGAPLLAGRDFNAHDLPNSPRVALASESFARKYFPGQNPIGRRFRTDLGNKLSDPVEIVGLVRDAKWLDLREDSRPAIYVSASQNANPGKMVTFEIRALAGNGTALVQEAKHAVNEIDANASLQFRTLAGQVNQSLSRERLLATLAGFFGGLALLLAVLGLYGVTSYNMTRRRKEIGIRMALGARQTRVLLSVLKEVGILIGIGLGIGMIATICATHLLASFLYGVKANDGGMLSLAAAILALIAMMAGFLPAHRASRSDPMEALREE